MFWGSMLFLTVFLILGFIAKNSSLVFAVMFVMLLKVSHVDYKFLQIIQLKGINLGVTIITIAILMPIATNQVGLKDLFDSFKSVAGWVGLFSGILVSLLSKKGVGYMAGDPQVTVSLVMGTIIAVTLFRGIAAGPVIAAGIAYMAMQLIDVFNR